MARRILSGYLPVFAMFHECLATPKYLCLFLKLNLRLEDEISGNMQKMVSVTFRSDFIHKKSIKLCCTQITAVSRAVGQGSGNSPILLLQKCYVLIVLS